MLRQSVKRGTIQPINPISPWANVVRTLLTLLGAKRGSKGRPAGRRGAMQPEPVYRLVCPARLPSVEQERESQDCKPDAHDGRCAAQPQCCTKSSSAQRNLTGRIMALT